MSDPVLTERVKLAASALNALATASLAVGVLAPSAAILYGVSTPTAPAWELALGAAIWILFAAALHHEAQRLLGRLQP
ncbi:hypothetical protein [uncultured Methylobacterium sp.]|uniref:hypothetical protein n=1 Tax=uncultured Methylobacterium sp. TaxID=157278 RepID=UPI0035CC5DEF